MKDFDFDELDHAVNSLITNTPVSSDSVNEPNAVTPSLSSQSFGQPLPSLNPAQPLAPVAPAAERPSTGRFMDVVRPASNMRANFVMPERNLRQNMEPQPVMSRPATPATSAPAPISTMPTPMPITNNWPTTSAPSSDDDDADINQLGDDLANELGQTINTPLESPFLSGAKVEKRPLGAFSDEQPTAPVIAPQAQPQEDMSFMQNMLASQSDVANSPLPAELQDDLLLIESDNAPQPIDAPVIKAEPNMLMTPTEPVVPTAAPEVSTVPTPAASAEASVQPIAATSITQQYKEQPSSGDQNTGAIYDTNAYHKALAPTKKKSGWLWVLWIFLLLLIGAGAGAAVYFLVLPNL